MPEESVQFCKELGASLSKAEIYPESMLEQKEASMSEYNSMAFNYEDQGNYVTACYFYQKVIDIAISCKVTPPAFRTNSTNSSPYSGWANASTRRTTKSKP